MNIAFNHEHGPLGMLRMELDLNAQHMISQVHMNNQSMKDAMEEGIKRAFEEICVDGKFIDFVKEETKKQIEAVTHKALMGYEITRLIQTEIETAVSAKIKEYAVKVAEKLTKELN